MRRIQFAVAAFVLHTRERAGERLNVSTYVLYRIPCGCGVVMVAGPDKVPLVFCRFPHPPMQGSGEEAARLLARDLDHAATVLAQRCSSAGVLRVDLCTDDESELERKVSAACRVLDANLVIVRP